MNQFRPEGRWQRVLADVLGAGLWMAWAVLLAASGRWVLVGLSMFNAYGWGGRRLWLEWRHRRGVPTRRSVEPIRAVKSARLIGVGESLAFLPLGAGVGAYGVDERARCWKGHKAPDLGCQCGFYAVKGWTPHSGMVRWGGSVRLDVEFYGRVIRHGKVYRGERQRVLRVVVKRCWWCYPFCRRRAVGVSLWHPVCAKHRPTTDYYTFMSLEDMCGALGTEVMARGAERRKG